MAGLSPLNLGNVLAQAEGIKGARLRNQMLQRDFEQPLGSVSMEDTAQIKNYTFYQKLSPGNKGTFDHIIRGQNIKKIGNVWNIVTPDNQLIPLGSLANELESAGSMADIKERGKLGAQQEIKPLIEQELQDVRLRTEPGIAAAVTTASGYAAAEVKEKVLQRANTRTYETFEIGIGKLLKALNRTITGPLVGQFPAFTGKQQIAEGAAAAMAPILKQLFRASGEGIFTDRDQALLMEMLPSRVDTNEAVVEKLSSIDELVRSKLGMAPLDTGVDDDYNALIEKYLQ